MAIDLVLSRRFRCGAAAAVHGMMNTGEGGGAALEIPASTKKVVQDLKEVVGNSEEEIYAMLKECNMDPNETAQRLLNQGTFLLPVSRWSGSFRLFTCVGGSCPTLVDESE